MVSVSEGEKMLYWGAWNGVECLRICTSPVKCVWFETNNRYRPVTFLNNRASNIDQTSIVGYMIILDF